MMRIGQLRTGSEKRLDTVCLPSQVTGLATPSVVWTRSPRVSVSTGTSPSGVRIRVPAMKQMICKVSTVPDCQSA